MLNQNQKDMKRIFLFALMLAFAVGTMAQLSKTAQKYAQKVPRYAIDNAIVNPLQPHNSTVNTKSVMDDALGTTRYDLQTNEACQNRMYVYPDGTMGGTWTMGSVETSFPERGTGYNYYNGTTWGTAPSVRIESVRTGWPSYNPWKGGGEIVVAHNSTTSLVMNTRTVKGTGSWTQTNAPTAPSGAPGICWSRTITSGPTNLFVHVIALTLPSANGGAVYKGLDGALLYWRSPDGGTTWDVNGVQIPGLDSSNYVAFGGDEYAWGAPHGDTIYFVAGGPYSDLYLMKSYNNGTTWTKTEILSNANKKLKTVPAYMAPWRSSDGSTACEMDKHGVFHVVSGIGGGEIQSSTEYIIINQNGLMYWNSTMPPLKDSLNLDTLLAHGQLIGWYSNGPNPGDTLTTVQSYRVGLTSHPQINIDPVTAYIDVIWDGITYQNPDPQLGNYRHIWGRGWNPDQGWTNNQYDYNQDISYIFTEFVFPSMGKIMLPGTNCPKIDYICQTAAEPGSALVTTTLAYQTCTIEHFQQTTCLLVGVAPQPEPKKTFVGQNFPNPVVDGTTTFNMFLNNDSPVIINITNITGQTVMTLDKGTVASGAHQFTINTANLNAGIYFYTVRINGESSTHKMIVE